MCEVFSTTGDEIQYDPRVLWSAQQRESSAMSCPPLEDQPDSLYQIWLFATGGRHIIPKAKKVQVNVTGNLPRIVDGVGRHVLIAP